MLTDDRTDPHLRVASIPAAHPYVTGATASAAGSVTLLSDPPPLGAAPGQWWPPVMLTPQWLREHRAEFDVLHVHFGMESSSPEELRAVVEIAGELRVPIVYTAHDLVNPQLVDQTRHLAHLDTVMAAADRIVTLTPGAAAEIERRWGRETVVLPHPHLHPFDARTPIGTRSGALLLGTHLRDLRPSIDGAGTVSALLDAVADLRGRGVDAEGRVHLRDATRDDDQARLIEDLLAQADTPVTLVRSPRHTDAELAESIADLDVSVLPYAFGTHSGWVELCFDLGVPVAGRAVGYIAEQHPEDFAATASWDGRALADAVATLTTGRRSRPGTSERADLVARRREGRRGEHERSGLAHRELYRSLLQVGIPA